MALTQAVIQSTIGTASGNVDFTSTGFGSAVAAIILVGEVGGAAGNMAISYGFTDGTNHRCSAMSHGEGSPVTRGVRYHSRTQVYHYAGSNESASFVSFITDGIRLNFPNTPSSDKPITIILFKGADVLVGDRLLTTGVDPVTGIGFRPNLLFTSTIGLGATLDSNQNAGILGLGIVHDDAGTVTQYTQVLQSDANANQLASVLGAWASAQLFSTVTWSTVAQNFGADGWDFNTTGTSNDLVHYLAINTQGVGVNIEQIDSPIVTGSFANTGQGFTPDFLMVLASTSTTVGAVKSGDFGSVYSVSFDGNAQSVSADESTAAELSEAFQSSRAVDMRLTDSAGSFDPQVQASLTSYDALGYTLNWTTVTGNVRRFATLTLEAPAPSTIIDVPSGLVNLAGIIPSIALPVTIIPASGLINLAGLTPAVATPISIMVSAGIVNISGLTPVINLPADIAGQVGVINITGLAPEVTSEITITAPVGAVSIGGLAPLIGTPLSISIPFGLVQLIGVAPSVVSGINIDIGLGSIGLLGLPPNIGLGIGINVPPGSVVINGLTPSLSIPINIVVPAGLIVLAGLTPTVNSLSGIITPPERVIIQRDIDRVIIVVNIDRIIIINN